jgi:hypothetical protein
VNSRIATLEDNVNKKDKRIQELASTVISKTSELSNALKEIKSLRTIVSELNSKTSAETWKCFRKISNEARPTLLVGSSIIRDISPSHLDNTDVICKPGGHISDIADEVTKVPSDRYERIVLVAGGNNCDPKNRSAAIETPSEIVNEYRSLVSLCKQKSNKVLVSSVCPRLKGPEITNRIDSVNAGLQVLCGEENVSYIDNSVFFSLKDDSVNDAYLLDDGCHLTYKATDRLAQNLQLQLKDGINSVCSNDRTKKKFIARKNNKEHVSSSTDVTEDNLNGLSYPFWHKARQKVSSTRNHMSDHRPTLHTSRPSQESYQNERARTRETRCYHCYETNHTKNSCRHEHPIVCNYCGEEGHKSKHHQH